MLPHVQVQPVKARGATIQNAEPIFAPLDSKVRLDPAVHGEPIPKNAMGIPAIEYQPVVFVEEQVHEHQRDVIIAARKPPSRSVGVVFVSGVLLVKQQVEAEEARVDIGC
ncbi:MAG: hypothetical protein DLM68_11740 [Hyphomicrobiales bacterium]|nr:MAG: hypothetical protein DLM68_11740 [Hyphomicrobiales bacterium]